VSRQPKKKSSHSSHLIQYPPTRIHSFIIMSDPSNSTLDPDAEEISTPQQEYERMYKHMQQMALDAAAAESAHPGSTQALAASIVAAAAAADSHSDTEDEEDDDTVYQWPGLTLTHQQMMALRHRSWVPLFRAHTPRTMFIFLLIAAIHLLQCCSCACNLLFPSFLLLSPRCVPLLPIHPHIILCLSCIGD